MLPQRSGQIRCISPQRAPKRDRPTILGVVMVLSVSELEREKTTQHLSALRRDLAEDKASRRKVRTVRLSDTPLIINDPIKVGALTALHRSIKKEGPHNDKLERVTRSKPKAS